MTSGPEPSQPAPVNPITTIAEMIARMEAIDGELPRKDGVAYFNRLYLQVTKAVQAAGANTTFEDLPFIDRLDVVFAGLALSAIYLDTLARAVELSSRGILI
jgi:hypothetical protein